MNDTRMASMVFDAYFVSSLERGSVTTSRSPESCSGAQRVAGLLTARPQHDAIGPEEVLDRRALLQKLRVRDHLERDLGRRVDAGLQGVARAHGHRALDHDDAGLLREGGHLLARGEHRADVGRAGRVGGGAHGEEVGVGRVVRRRDLRVEVQAPCALVALDQIAQARFVDRDDAVAQLPHPLRIDVDAEHVVSQLGEPGAGDEAYVAHAEGDETHGAYLVFRRKNAIE
jgi:hypothetical protein